MPSKINLPQVKAWGATRTPGGARYEIDGTFRPAAFTYLRGKDFQGKFSGRVASVDAPELSKEDKQAGKRWVRTGTHSFQSNNPRSGNQTHQMPVWEMMGGFGEKQVAKEEPKAEEPAPPPAEPPVFGGPDLDAAREEFDKTRPWSPGMEQPKLDAYGDPYEDAINHGNDLNDHYQKKFLPSLFNEAMLASREIGEAGRFHLKNFVGKVPELGDPKDLYNYYKDQIK